jgi:hypothetical protein
MFMGLFKDWILTTPRWFENVNTHEQIGNLSDISTRIPIEETLLQYI